MAKKTFVQITDDLDGSEDAKTVSFALKGVSYEIDLAAANEAELDAALAPYITAGRKAQKSTSRQTKPAVAGEYRDLAAVRTWAKANGHSVSDRGRVPQTVLVAYDEAH